MNLSTERVATQRLSLPEELILMLLNEESGYFHQVPGWNLNCGGRRRRTGGNCHSHHASTRIWSP